MSLAAIVFADYETAARKLQVSSNKGLASRDPLADSPQGQRPESNDPDLAAVIDAWDTLPEAVRASILMLVEAASNKNSALSTSVLPH